MDGFRVFILAMQATQAVLMIALAVPLCLRKVRPNGLYGFRVRRTLEDPAVWYLANAHAGRSLLVAGALILVLGVVLYFGGPADHATYAVAAAAVTLVTIAAAVVRSALFLRHLPR